MFLVANSGFSACNSWGFLPWSPLGLKLALDIV